MSEVIDLNTGEIKYATDLAPVDPKSDIAVTSYLQQARDWLATAVETTGPEQIAAAKAEIATAAEATKQLGLSKEIQEDAAEMVRRAEWTLRKAQQKAQAEGTMRTRESNFRKVKFDGPTPRDQFATTVEYREALDMGALEEHEFEAVIAEAKAEGNLSRANVARKARAVTGPKQQRATRRTPLPDFARDAVYDLEKVAERLERVVADDRFSDNRQAIADRTVGQITRSLELISAALAAINSETTP